MDKELERLIRSVIENAVDDSDASADLVESLATYYYDHFQDDHKYLIEFLETLRASAENGCSWAKFKFSQVVSQFGPAESGVITKDDKRLAVQYGKESGYALGYLFAAKILEEPDFRPCGYSFNEKEGHLGGHMFTEPDYDLLDAAECYQLVVDSIGSDDEMYLGFVLEAANKAALLFLNKRGFGPGISISSDDKLRAFDDLNLIIEKGNPEQVAYAASLLGTAELYAGNLDKAANWYIKALNEDPEAIFYFFIESGFQKESDTFRKLIELCDQTDILTRGFRPQIADRVQHAVRRFKALNGYDV